MRPPSITSDTVTDRLQEQPLSGATLREIRSWLSMGPVGLAKILNTTPENITALEAADDAALPPNQLDALTHAVHTALAVMTPAELRTRRELLNLDHDDLSAAIGLEARTIQRGESGVRAISTTIRDRITELLRDYAHQTRAMTTHLQGLAQQTPHEQLQVLTYRAGHELRAAQALLPEDPSHDDAPTALLRTSPSDSWHRAIAGTAALAVGVRLSYT